jgi:hypothetical protein
MPVAPATLAGRGVIELIGADAGKLRRGPSFLPVRPGGISPREIRRHLHSGACRAHLVSAPSRYCRLSYGSDLLKFARSYPGVTPPRSRGWSEEAIGMWSRPIEELAVRNVELDPSSKAFVPARAGVKRRSGTISEGGGLFVGPMEEPSP